MYKAPSSLLVLIILLDFIIQAIIVERNLHSYYRLPTTTVKTSNDSEEYYILQCPFKSSLNIPKPQDMPVCIIVGRHSENEEKQKELIKAKPRTNLNTQVDYRYLKPPKLLKVVTMKNGKPYTMYLKPINKKLETYKRPKTEIKEMYKATNIKLLLPNPRMLLNQSTILYPVPMVQKMLINDSVALSSTNEPQKLTQTLQPPPSEMETDFVDDPLDEEDTQASLLKYLGVQDTLKQLQLSQKLPRPKATNQTVFKGEKFFADLKNYKKGYRTKGYQNMYHRDEIYQDHIFYDDLQQMGNYRIKEKVQEKEP
ncbi:uncharacterized protein LOC111678490 [Lucilia cuprina]|uniref:uncharacterized protein LOC111678490 n=1 Tax=Lucilia cuprina TaxID=7375 RepID=UPI001F05EE09|nr:uncharacterized protein LOC111678490 [Lucilia cuprina]